VLGHNIQYTYYKFSRGITIILFSLLSLAFIYTLLYIFNFHILSKFIYDLNDNWIILFFKLNAGLSKRASLQTLHIIDFVLLALFGLLYFAFFFILKRKNIVYFCFSVFALISPFLGIFLLAITHSGGRTGILTGGLIFSILMLINNKFGKLIAIIGILANSILLISCDILSLNHISRITSIFILSGYLIWIFWLVLLSNRFSRILGTNK